MSEYVDLGLGLLSAIAVMVVGIWGANSKVNQVINILEAILQRDLDRDGDIGEAGGNAQGFGSQPGNES